MDINHLFTWKFIVLLLHVCNMGAIEDGVCEDARTDCFELKIKGLCENAHHLPDVGEMCAKTCGLCNCKDTKPETQCQFWADHRACRSHPHVMAKWCPRTCGLCNSEEKCRRVKCEPPRKCSLDKQGNPVCICIRSCKHKRAKRSLGMVCGTNNKEYSDRCRLEHAACRANKTISVKQYGACPAMSPPCADSYDDDQCSSWKPFGVCETYKELMKVACPYTCGLCKLGASSLPKCQLSKYGCCPDLKSSAAGPLGQGCGNCRDRKALCRHFMRDCNSSNLSNRKFMEKHCRKSCGLCLTK